jgi:hypothetical protein
MTPFEIAVAIRNRGESEELRAFVLRTMANEKMRDLRLALELCIGWERSIGDPDRLPRCVICGEEGIAPVERQAHLDVRDGGKSGLRPI